MPKKLKDILWGVFAIVLIVVCAVWFLNSDLEPIEDTNGPDDASLTTVTDENIINLDMGAINPVKIKKSGFNMGGLSVNSMVEFSSKNFSGVYEICYNNYLGKSDFVLELGSLKVESGNFKMVVLVNDEIVATIEPSDERIYYCLEDISGYVSVRIAGESAAYSFTMSQIDYDHFAHN